MKYYTGKGDSGTTSVGSRSARKDEPLVHALGDIDELNSSVGLAAASISDEHLEDMLKGVQNTLFVAGAELASLPSDADRLAKISDRTRDLESAIEELGATLPELRKFVLPSGTVGASSLHLARAICRRAERSVIALSLPDASLGRYLNRLSSFLFVAALYVNKKEGVDESNPAYS